MYTIEDIRAFEEAGFSRRQAEMQVKIVTTFKHEFRIAMKELSDKLDANFKAIDKRFDLQDQKFEMHEKHLSAQDKRIDAQDRKLDAQDRKLEAIPFKTTIYLVAAILSIASFIAVLPVIKTWLEYLIVK